MPKKVATKKRTRVKDLPKKSRKLGTDDMKKVKGGASDFILVLDGVKGQSSERPPSRPRPGT